MFPHTQFTPRFTCLRRQSIIFDVQRPAFSEEPPNLLGISRLLKETSYHPATFSDMEKLCFSAPQVVILVDWNGLVPVNSSVLVAGNWNLVGVSCHIQDTADLIIGLHALI